MITFKTIWNRQLRWKNQKALPPSYQRQTFHNILEHNQFQHILKLAERGAIKLVDAPTAISLTAAEQTFISFLLPEGILDYFELKVEKATKELHIYLEEKNIAPSGYQIKVYS